MNFKHLLKISSYIIALLIGILILVSVIIIFADSRCGNNKYSNNILKGVDEKICDVNNINNIDDNNTCNKNSTQLYFDINKLIIKNRKYMIVGKINKYSQNEFGYQNYDMNNNFFDVVSLLRERINDTYTKYTLNRCNDNNNDIIIEITNDNNNNNKICILKNDTKICNKKSDNNLLLYFENYGFITNIYNNYHIANDNLMIINYFSDYIDNYVFAFMSYLLISY
jgi:hypothetical protein